MKAPKDCPPPPVHLTVKVSSGRLLPWSRVMSEPRMVAQGPVGTGDGDVHRPLLPLLQRPLHLLQQDPHVHRLLQLEVIGVRGVEMALDLRPFKRVVQNGGQVHRGGPLVDGVLPHLQQVGAAHQLVHGTHPQAGHVLPQLLGHEAHEVHHILRFSGEAPPQLRVLGGDPCRAGAQVAHPHHARSPW